MCGRYTNATTWAEVHAASTPLPVLAPAVPPGIELNIAPTARAWVLRPDAEGVLRAARLRWGLVPAWSEAPSTKFSAFNARVESVAEKPVFRGAFRARRCLVPASGWYEWREEVGRKIPHLFEPAAGGALLFAGLWERWQRGDWDQLIEGEVCMLDGSHSVFGPEPITPELIERAHRMDIHPTGPLWGTGALRCAGALAELETQCAAQFEALRAGLESIDLKQERRALRLPVRELVWRFEDDVTLQIEFFLPAGAFATSVLEALGEITDAAGRGGE